MRLLESILQLLQISRLTFSSQSDFQKMKLTFATQALDEGLQVDVHLKHLVNGGSRFVLTFFLHIIKSCTTSLIFHSFSFIVSYTVFVVNGWKHAFDGSTISCSLCECETSSWLRMTAKKPFKLEQISNIVDLFIWPLTDERERNKI